MKILFLGNSATYVHEIPNTLAKLAADLGYEIEIGQITPGGCELAKHADIMCEHGRFVNDEINKGYDIVILQDNGNCISSEEKTNACINACASLIKKIKDSGAIPMIYVRPPYGYEKFGCTQMEMCREFDDLFLKIANDYGVKCVFVNRAFAYVIKNRDYNLWGSDNAHTSKIGAYLATCVFFATIFEKSATMLGLCDIDENIALDLQEIADKIVFDGEISW